MIQILFHLLLTVLYLFIMLNLFGAFLHAWSNTNRVTVREVGY